MVVTLVVVVVVVAVVAVVLVVLVVVVEKGDELELKVNIGATNISPKPFFASEISKALVLATASGDAKG